MAWRISRPGVRPVWRRHLVWLGVTAVLVLCVAAPRVAAASLSDRELQVIGRAAAFLQPPLGGGTVAVVYDPDDPVSRQDAAAIVAEIGSGLAVAGVTLSARAVPPEALAGGRYTLVLAAAGAGGQALGLAIRAAHVLCVTADLAAVQAGTCTMAVTTDLRVQIVLNHAAAAASGVSFAAAFRMMIHEI